MGKMVSQLFGGGGGKARRAEMAKDAKAREDQAVALTRQQQERATADATTEASLSRARRTPRGRRLLIGEQGDTLG